MRANEEARQARAAFEIREQQLRDEIREAHEEKKEADAQFDKRFADEHSRLMDEVSSHRLDLKRLTEDAAQHEVRLGGGWGRGKLGNDSSLTLCSTLA